MFEQSLNKELFARYTKILGASPKAPSYDYLKELVASHIKKIPFENVSKIYYNKIKGLNGLVDLYMYLDGIEKYNFGGTCYSNNYYLYLLLKYIGFDVKMCGADMTNPDVHIVNMVSTGGREYIVDCGYGAPFIVPMPRDLDHDFFITQGNIKYVLKPQDVNQCSSLEIYENGEYKHGYLVKPEPRAIEYFEKVINNSFRKEATFFNALLLTRFFEDSSIMIRNMNLIEYQSREAKTYIIKSRSELVEIIEKRFKIPKEIVKPVLDELPEFRNAWN